MEGNAPTSAVGRRAGAKARRAPGVGRLCAAETDGAGGAAGNGAPPAPGPPATVARGRRHGERRAARAARKARFQAMGRSGSPGPPMHSAPHRHVSITEAQARRLSRHSRLAIGVLQQGKDAPDRVSLSIVVLRGCTGSPVWPRGAWRQRSPRAGEAGHVQAETDGAGSTRPPAPGPPRGSRGAGGTASGGGAARATPEGETSLAADARQGRSACSVSRP